MKEKHSDKFTITPGNPPASDQKPTQARINYTTITINNHTTNTINDHTTNTINRHAITILIHLLIIY